MSEVTQSCSTVGDTMNCSLPDSSVHGIFQVRILEWVAISFSIGGDRCVHNLDFDDDFLYICQNLLYTLYMCSLLCEL